MSNIVKFPGPRKRKIDRAKERFAKLVLVMKAAEEFTDIRTQSDLDALAVTNPIRFKRFMAFDLVFRELRAG